jgi:hypothetical protein
LAFDIEIAAAAEEFFRRKRLASHHCRLRLLALTYEFDLGAFHRAFENILQWQVRVDVVRGTPDKYGDREPTNLGSGSVPRVWRAQWKGTFHPKMICLLADDEVMVGIGSANLTAAGLGERLETWKYFAKQHDVDLLAGVRNFLTQASEQKIIPSQVNCKEIIEALPKRRASATPLLSTLYGSLIDQIVATVLKPVKRIDIVSPIDGNPDRVLSKLVDRLAMSPEIHLFSNDPMPRLAHTAHYYKLLRPSRTAKAAEVEIRILTSVHAKIFAFETSNHVDVFWGSANLSQPAWLAVGRKANVDILVHSRVSQKEWRKLRDNLPPKHKWAIANPSKNKEIERKQVASWEILYASIEHGHVDFAANMHGVLNVRLRTQSAETQCELNFRKQNGEIQARLAPTPAAKLALKDPPYPRFIKAQIPGMGWQNIPLNNLDTISDDPSIRSLEDLLLWEYTGRTFVKRNRTKKLSSPDDDDKDKPDSAEEEELSHFTHQGELDKVVLKWRAIAKRVALSSGTNDQLKLSRLKEIGSRVESSALESPHEWPSFKKRFVQKVLERAWPK